uniref:Ig-like domain-containing protein n=1 Tax=Esox lucius TaxID=8010 RepID=A0AAY5K6H3_ESOLU
LIYCGHSQDLPTASLSVSPHGLLYSGETVTLQCDISGYPDLTYYWTYYWYRNGKLQSPGSPSNTITTLSDLVNQYQCVGTKTYHPQASQRSVLLQITVTDLPTASVSVSPHGLLYSGETVTLQCNISDYTGWTYRWYQNNQTLPTQTSKTIRYIIPIIKTGQTDLYRCEGMRTKRPQRSQPSNEFSISVTGNKPKATLSFNQKDVLTGVSVTLTCTVESSGWRFYWYRYRQDSEPVATTSGSSYTLSQVSVSDEGQYRCRAGRGDPVYYTQYSEPVHIQVT